MQQTSTPQARPTPAWRSPWVIAWFALVVSVLVINGVMVYFAVTTNPGLVVEDYYDRGQSYENHLVSNLVQDPGWAMRADVPRDIKAGETRVFQFFVSDRSGQPVALDGVTFYAYRPSDLSRDFSLPMEMEGPGRYAVKVSFPLMGTWDTLFAARMGGDEYSVGQRLSIARP
jgi:nitrogen fixation protein FixH